MVDAPLVEVTGDQTVRLTATVTDAETAPTQLTYLWSALPANGTFTGASAQVRWKPQPGGADPFSITLTVVENYGSGATAKENRTSLTVPVRFNEMVVAGLASQFLTDFGTFAVSPQQCVRNFSTALCSGGRASELGDITSQRNRPNIQIESATFPTPSVNFVTSTSASISTRCTFRDRQSNGITGAITGSCDLTAVYDSPRWYLCTSNFNRPFVCDPGPCPSSLSKTLSLYSHP